MFQMFIFLYKTVDDVDSNRNQRSSTILIYSIVYYDKSA